MIIDKFVYIRGHSRNFEHFKKLGYDVKVGVDLLVNPIHLKEGSALVINCQCDYCNKKIPMEYRFYFSYTKGLTELYYCISCKEIKSKKTCLEKYGVDNPMKSKEVQNTLKKSLLEKYGVNYFSKTSEYKEKYKATCLEKYDTINTFQVDKFKEKSINTIFSKYGTSHYSRTKEFKDRYKKSRNNFTIDTYSNNIDLTEYEIKNYTDDFFHILHKKCNSEFIIHRKLLYSRNKQRVEYCTSCNQIGSQQSNIEKEITSFFKNIGIKNIVENSRTTIIGSELDIYLPDYHVAFEVNGIYWHNELYKEKNYHLNKTSLCKERGIQLIHIWEDDWKNKREIIESMILNKLGKTPNKIYARKCEVKIVKNSSDFLNQNHIQGQSPSKLKYGLFYNNELVSLMTFGWRKTNSKHEFELIRFCNKINTIVIGSASKLFNFFIRKTEVDKIISYCDISQFNGDLYQKLNFKCDHVNPPNYWWVVDGRRRHRFAFNKKKLVKEGFDSKKTEVEIMNERGYFRIWGCGTQKWIFSK